MELELLQRIKLSDFESSWLISEIIMCHRDTEALRKFQKGIASV
jgi:hypothetical protein